jgi:hypothetical protein
MFWWIFRPRLLSALLAVSVALKFSPPGDRLRWRGNKVAGPKVLNAHFPWRFLQMHLIRADRYGAQPPRSRAGRIVVALPDTYGRTYCEKLGIEIRRNRPSVFFSGSSQL